MLESLWRQALWIRCGSYAWVRVSGARGGRTQTLELNRRQHVMTPCAPCFLEDERYLLPFLNAAGSVLIGFLELDRVT